jgi:CheY-like chemotaxis protein
MTANDRKGVAGDLGRILVVEDSPSARRLMQDILLRLGAELPNLRLAGTVLEGLTLFSQWRPDVVFVDVQLQPSPRTPFPSDGPPRPGREPADGAELVALFLERRPSVRIVLCSATDPSDPPLSKLISEQKVEFLTKPLVAFRVEELLGRLVSKSSPARS